jgi:hypothetical protein
MPGGTGAEGAALVQQQVFGAAATTNAASRQGWGERLQYQRADGAVAGWATEFAARTPDCLPTATFFAEPSAARYVAEALSDGTRRFKAHV